METRFNDPGTVVRLHSLSRRPDLNGRTGTVVVPTPADAAKLSSEQRVKVLLHSGHDNPWLGELAAVRSNNLELLATCGHLANGQQLPAHDDEEIWLPGAPAKLPMGFQVMCTAGCMRDLVFRLRGLLSEGKTDSIARVSAVPYS